MLGSLLPISVLNCPIRTVQLMRLNSSTWNSLTSQDLRTVGSCILLLHRCTLPWHTHYITVWNTYHLVYRWVYSVIECRNMTFSSLLMLESSWYFPIQKRRVILLKQVIKLGEVHPGLGSHNSWIHIIK